MFTNEYVALRNTNELLGSTTDRPTITSESQVGEQKELFFFRLSTDGNGAGDTNMGVDGSVTPVKFYCKPPAGEVWRVARSMLYVQDEKGFDVGTWGSGIVLANGMDVEVKINGVTKNILGYPLKTSGEVAGIAFDIELLTFGNADDVLAARWTFTMSGQYIRLVGDDGDEFSVTVNDDMSSLSAQYIQLQGYKE